MNKYLENFYRLYSEDDKVVYQAVLEKRNWILKEFFIVCSLVDNRDIEDILDGNLRFRKLYVNPNLFNGDNEKCKLVNDAFNSQLKVLYLWEKIPFCEEDEFIVKLDFKKLDDLMYKRLFANFFPCFKTKEIPIPQSEEIDQIIPVAMENSLGDAVIVLDDDQLIDNCLNVRVISEIIVPSSLNEGFIPYLQQISKAINVTLRRL